MKFWGIDEKAGDSNKLKLGSGNFPFLEMMVDEIRGQVQRFADELELEMKFDRPINYNGPYSFC